MILGISASGRANGETAKMVKDVLEASGLEYSYVSLSGKRISGCTGCLQCAGDGICKVRDDWNDIATAMIKAEAIVFGAPTYTFNINALEHSRMGILCTVNSENAIAPCWECGYGHDCMAGSVVRSNDGQTVDEITPEMVPAGVERSETVQREIACAGWMLAKAIRKD